MSLSKEIDHLPNTSRLTIAKLKKIGIEKYWDLLNYFPFRYEPFQTISSIADAQDGETLTIKGVITEAKHQFTRNRLRIQKFEIKDETGIIEAVWFNQPYLLSILKKGMVIFVSGQIKKSARKVSIIPKEYEIVHNEADRGKHTGRLVPIYSETRGLSTKTIREKIWFLINNYIDEIDEFLPRSIIEYNNLLDEKTAYSSIHFPQSNKLLSKAKERLIFDELFLIQLSSFFVKKKWAKETTKFTLKYDKFKTQIDTFIKSLPFALTSAQKRVLDEVFYDLTKLNPMNRLLQGDVGSGKTVVAAIISYLCYLNGYQTLIMAPTEILAGQHFETFKSLFKLSVKNKINIALLTSSHNLTSNGIKKMDIIIGTHALLEKKYQFTRVGLVIIDEQHRFGVKQRALIKQKGYNPHLLTMTATPIPRTVSLTLFGQLDMSILDEMPANRLPVKTYLIPENKRISCYEWIKKQIVEMKMQAYIICPLVDESTVETTQSVKAATNEFSVLQTKIFPELKLGLIHGRLKSVQKNKVMDLFRQNKINILVSTSIVEVGVDIPNSNIMIIEGAERFGYSQLHQLRGRIGRGDKQSYCFLFTSSSDNTISNRLSFFVKTNDGNSLAEKDLQERGPGNLFGIEQHGYLRLKIAPLTDYQLISNIRKSVIYFDKHYSIGDFPKLATRIELYGLGLISDN